MKTLALTTVAACIALGACATSPVPAVRLAQSEAAIRSAKEAGAEKVPPAALHLQVAMDELDLARKLIYYGSNERADYMLLRAEADADVALTFTREAAARDAAEKTLIEVQKLRNSQSSRPEGT